MFILFRSREVWVGQKNFNPPRLSCVTRIPARPGYVNGLDQSCRLGSRIDPPLPPPARDRARVRGGSSTLGDGVPGSAPDGVLGSAPNGV